jgi:hypothetical protein
MVYNTPIEPWEYVKVLICTSDKKNLIHLIIILSSQKRTFGRFDLTAAKYRKITGKKLNKSTTRISNVSEALKKVDWDLSRNGRYVKVPKWFLEIPLKNTFALKVAHYYISIHNMGGKSYKFDVFCKKYKITPNRKNKHKFNKIIQSL